MPCKHGHDRESAEEQSEFARPGRRRPSAALVIACLALFVAIGGGAYAAGLAKNSVSSKQVKDRSLVGKDLKADTLTGAEVNEGSLGKVPSATNAGAVGPNGVDGTAIVDNAVTGTDVNEATLDLHLARVSASSADDSTSPKSATVTCPEGKFVIDSGWGVTGGPTGVAPNIGKQVFADEVLPSVDLKSVTATAYEAPATAGNWHVRAIAICAAVAG